ncbi:hypothetical protein L861_01525 [Litchfieldella anticariensis FP35 = DSM 16096]|uniref:Uncharacterized protein n=1 Tax=Litchfieldella anticariensis (strain DSM 16096 / CECT 5854 / CIP 108499 / LMG 22089 / FP35) TaxID=1121939 RepID=S2LH74_LITA3|nr:hypothetical protein [Halomonas anticariensis]EPC04011.1 hypothetical protein L861_01525 [Halomonas anticariensis FP35 = DSM 16096]
MDTHSKPPKLMDRVKATMRVKRHVLDQPLGDIGEFSHAKRPRRLPVVLSHAEVMRVLNELSGPMHLMATLMYGSELQKKEGKTQGDGNATAPTRQNG